MSKVFTPLYTWTATADAELLMALLLHWSPPFITLVIPPTNVIKPSIMVLMSCRFWCRVEVFHDEIAFYSAFYSAADGRPRPYDLAKHMIEIIMTTIFHSGKFSSVLFVGKTIGL